MNCLCNACSLHIDIEKNRSRLNSLIVEKNHMLLDEEIIKLSQSLDVLVYNCIFCNKNLNNVSRLDLRKISGIHSTFYYYGHHHLFNSMYIYITEGIKNNEIIYISMERNLYNALIIFLKDHNISVDNIKFRSVKDLIDSNTYGGLVKLREKIQNICSEDEVKEYNGVRWIGQQSYAIQSTSQEEFLSWETNLSEALRNTNSSLICIYDAYDYMSKGEFINKTVIKQSLLTHSYVLQNSVLEQISC